MTIENDRVTDLLYQYQELLSYQWVWLPEWQELADYILPRKNSIAVQRIPGYKRTQRLFDSTAPHDMELLSAAIHGTLTPSFTRWFALIVDDEQLQQDSKVRNWLDIVNNKIRTELNKSNFNSEVHEMYVDINTFGTACLYEDELSEGKWFGGLRFSSVPIGKFCISEDKSGKVDTVFRTVPMTTHAILNQWPDTAPDEIKDSQKPDQLWEIIHAVVPNTNQNGDKYRWTSHYIFYKNRTELSYKGYYDFPFMVPRWTRYADEIYGRGPSHVAIPDIRTLNKIIEMELRNLAKNVDPPLGQVQGEVVGPARMIPGGITTLKGGRESLFPIDTGGKYEVVNLKKEELRLSIHNMYHIDQLQLNVGPQMTATEVNVRYETMQRVLGPMLGRIESEFSRPMIDRSFMLMYRAGLFNPLPDTLIQAIRTKPISLRIQYEGPLARSQRSSDLTAMDHFSQSIAPLLKVDQDVIDVIDFDEIVRHEADVLGIPTKAVRDKAQVEKIRSERHKVIEQQQQNEQIAQSAEAGKQVAPLIKALQDRPKIGSILSKVV